MNGRSFFICFLITILVGCSPPPDDNEAVCLAANLPLSGILGRWGKAIQLGTEFALEEHLSPSERALLRIDWQDNQSSPQFAVNIMRRQLTTKPDLYTSGLMPQVLAIKNEIDKREIPHFVWMFSKKINEKKKNNYRILINYAVEPPLFLRYVATHRPKRAAVIYVLLPPVIQEYTEEIIPGLKLRGVENVHTESYPIDQQDFKSIIERVKQSQPELTIISGFSHNMVGLVKAIRSSGLAKSSTIIASYDLIDAASTLRAEDLEGFIVSSPSFLISGIENSKFVDWYSRFENRFGEKPFYIHTYGYEFGLVVAHLVKRWKKEGPYKIKEELDSMNYEGLTTWLRFPKDGSVPTPVTLGVFRKGNLSLLPP